MGSKFGKKEKSRIQINQNSSNVSFQGTPRIILNHRALRLSSGFSGELSANRKGDKGLSYKEGRVKTLAFYRELEELRQGVMEKKVRFSPLCCALLLGTFPLVLSAAMSNGTITGTQAPFTFTNQLQNVVNQGAIQPGDITSPATPANTTLTNTDQGTIQARLRNPGGNFTIINRGLISTSFSQNSTGLDERSILGMGGTVFITNEAGGRIIGGLRQYGNGNMNVNITNAGSIESRDILLEGRGTISISNTGLIETITNSSTGNFNLNSTGGNIATIFNGGNLATINNSANIGTIDNTTTQAVTTTTVSRTGTLTLTNNAGGSIDLISNSVAGAILNLGTNSGSIATLNNQGTINTNFVNIGTLTSFINGGILSGSLDNQSSGTIGDISITGSIRDGISNAGTIATINNNSVVTIANTTGSISSIVNSASATLNFGANGGSIGALDNQGTISTNLTNTGTLGTLINVGTLLGSLDNQSGGIINDINNTGSIRDGISNAGVIRGTLSNSSVSNLSITNTSSIANIVNTTAATLNNTGNIKSISNTSNSATLNLVVAGTIGTIDNQGTISGNIDGLTDKISNTGTILGTISNSSNSNLSISNSGIVAGGLKASGSSSINLTSSGDNSVLGGVSNEGSGKITVSGLTAIKNPGSNPSSGTYDIKNSGGGSVEVTNLFVDLEPYVRSYQTHGNFSSAYKSRVSLGGSDMDSIDIDHVTVRLTGGVPLDEFLKQTVNVSQFINGAFGDSNRDAHDCSGGDVANCEVQTDAEGKEVKIYAGKGSSLIKGLKDNIRNDKFITIQGDKAFKLELGDEYGNFSVVATPQSSPAATTTKVFLSSMKTNTAFVDNVVSSSIEDLKYYFQSPVNDDQRKTKALYLHDKNELYASLASDLVSQNVLKENSSYLDDATVYILPYFSSQSVHLDNGDTAKGHSRGLIAGYTASTKNNTFYSIYGGYQDTDMSSQDYDTGFRTLYAGFKVSDSLTNLRNNVEFFVQYDGKIARTLNSIRNNEVSANNANPKSYSWSLGADLGVNFFVGENTFTPQIGLGYEGGVIGAYTLVEKYDKTRFNTYHTRARVAWAREWGTHLQTVVEAGVRYYFNPEVEFGYELGGNHIKGKDKFARQSGFIGTDFIIPLNQDFYFKLSYNGVFSRDAKSHTGLAKFNYSF